MADKGKYDDLRRIITKECAELHDYIVSLDKQISEQLMHLGSTQSEEELVALMAGPEKMQKTLEKLEKFILESLKEIFATEDAVKDSLNERQMKFGFSEDLGDAHKSGLSPQSAKPKLEVYANIVEELMRECKEGFKKDSASAKKCLAEFLETCNLFDHEEMRALKAIHSQAVSVGNRLCCLFIDFLFMMSRQENLAAKIESLTSALRCVAELKNSIFIVQLFNALEMVAIEFRRMKTIEVTRERNLEDMASNRKRTKKELSENFPEQILYQLLDQFVMVAAHLESITSHPSLPELQMPRKEAVSVLQGGLTQCEKDLERIKNCISNIEAVAFSLLPLNDPKTRKIRKKLTFHIRFLI